MEARSIDSRNDSAARLRAVVGKLSRRLRPTIAGTGLTPTEISVLFSVVRGGGPMTLSTLAAIEGINPTALSRAVGRLVERRLLRREQLHSDRRAGLVEATAAGRRMRERIHRERNDVLSRRLAELTEREQQAIVEALDALEALAERLAGRQV